MQKGSLAADEFGRSNILMAEDIDCSSSKDDSNGTLPCSANVTTNGRPRCETVGHASGPKDCTGRKPPLELVIDRAKNIILDISCSSPCRILIHYRDNGSPVWKPECLWRTRRRFGGIFTSVRLCTSLWAGLGEGAFAHAGFQRRRSSNLASCPPTPFGSGARASIVFGACHAIEPSHR